MNQPFTSIRVSAKKVIFSRSTQVSLKALLDALNGGLLKRSTSRLSLFQYFLLASLLFRSSQTLRAQAPMIAPTEIYGKVTDASTKEALPYVNIQLVGSLRGTMTDPKGEFYIKTIEKVDSVTFSLIGYDTRTVAIKRGKTQELNIAMGSGELKITEITVKAKKRQKHIVDTAANYVYYQVLRNKDQNRSESINTYKYDSYDKLELSLLNPAKWLLNMHLLKPFGFIFQNRDTSENGDVIVPGILKETVSKVYYRKHPKAIKKFILADAITGIDNPSIGNLAHYQFAEINAYDNIFLLAAVSFVAPFSPAGISTYYYYLTDTAQIDGRTSYKLHFVGKVKEDLALKGYAWIDSATWGIRSMVFRPNEKANFNFIDDYTIKQDYVFFNNKDWLLKGEEMRTVGSALKKKLEMKLLITKTYERKNFEVDSIIPDSIFKGPDQEVLTDSARHRTRAYWDSARFIPLTPQEQEVYRISDTFKLVRAWKTLEFMGRLFSVAFADAGPISIGKILNFVSRNNVEGWRLRFGFETNPRFQHIGTPANNFLRKFYFTGYAAYGLGDRIWQYMALTRFMLPRKNDRWQSLEVMYRYDMRVPGQDPDQTLLTFDNVVNLISGTTLTKIMRTREFRITYEKEWLRGFSTAFATNDKVFYDIPGIFNFTQQNGETTVQIPNFHVTEFTIENRYSFNDQYFVSGAYHYFVATKYPVLLFRYTAGVVDLNEKYFNFHNLQLTLKQRLSSPIGHTYYTLQGAKILGKAPYTEAYMTQGNLGYLYDKFNYGLLNEFEFLSDQYVSLWVEHHFEGFFLNKIPGVNRLRMREVIFVKSLVGNFNQANSAVLVVPSDLSSPGPVPYVEAGFGIENILHLFRVDFVWRLTYRHLPGDPNWGVKFAFQPGF